MNARDDSARPSSQTSHCGPATASPSSSPSPRQSAANTAQPDPGAPSQHLLYIDDNPVNTLLMQEYFRLRKGPALQVAQTATEGLAMARSEPPLAVLLDLHLPDMDGMAVLALLRADPRTCALPVAIVSGSAGDGELQQALIQGADAVWSKPVDFRRLDQQLQSLLSRRQT